MVSLLWTHAAWAFCGGWVSYDAETIPNSASQVVLARSATEVVLTLGADALAPPQDFAMLLPVPEALDAADVAVVEPARLDALDAWTAPRGLALTCDDLFGGDSADTGADTGVAAGDTVAVEAQFVVGGWEITVVQAGGAEGLLAWLHAEGLVAPVAMEAVLDEYIASGQHFVVAQVHLDSLAEGATWPDPLQVRYPLSGPSVVLPVRLGAAVSAGTQEVVVWVLGAEGDGRYAVSNATEAPLEVGCLRPEGTTLADFYALHLDRTFEAGLWITEFAGPADPEVPCSICAGPVPDADALAALGSATGFPYVTRLRLRYAPEAVTQDLVLYPTGLVTPLVAHYLDPAEELAGVVPTCGEGVIGGGDCGQVEDTGDEPPLRWGDPPVPEAVEPPAAEGCWEGLAGVGVVVGLGVAARRRRR